MNIPAGVTCLYNPATDTYTFVYPGGTQFCLKGQDIQQMTHPGLGFYTGLGGLHGEYRTSTQTTYGSSSNGTYSGNPRIQAQIAFAQSQLAAQQAAISQQTANYLSGGGLTYSSTSGMTVLGNTFQQEAAPTIEYAGIKGEEIIAYRCWLIKGNPVKGYTLTSCFVEMPWYPNVPMTGDIGKPELYYYGLGYGVHSFKTKKLALEYGQGYIFNQCALGRVKLWGEVIEHEKGYRAENAKILSIDQVLNPKDNQRILRQLRKRYGVNEYANGNDTGSRQVGPGDGEEEGTDQGIGRNDIPSESRDSRKGGYWNYLRSLIQGRRV